MESELHSICTYCAPAFNGHHGKVFMGAVERIECCFCGHVHESGMVISLYDIKHDDGMMQRVHPWWCGGVLGTHRTDVRTVAALEGAA